MNSNILTHFDCIIIVLGWILLKLLYLEMNVNKFNPLRATAHIPLPEEIRTKKAVINLQNDDDYCFAWSVVAALYPPKGLEHETTSYPHYTSVLDLTGIEFPISLKNIHKFESQNNISINVYTIEKIKNEFKYVYEIIGPIHYTKNKQKKHVNLLLIGDGDGNFHYCYITDLSKLISVQLSKHHGKKHLCDGCLQYFTTEEHLVRHINFDCDFVRIELPSKELKLDTFGYNIPGNILKFQNIQKQMDVPFVIYADFECILKPLNNDSNTNLDPNSSYTIKNFEHLPYSFAYYIKCSFDDSISKFESYRGPNVAQTFVNFLERDAHNLYNKHLKVPKKMIELNSMEKLYCNYSNTCHICEKKIENSKEKVIDHCHITGKMRGIAHAICNLNYKQPNFIPIVLHNLRNYDSHLFIKNLCNNNEQLSVIAQNKEKYISFQKCIPVDTYIDKMTNQTKKKYLNLRFIDSFQFLPYSLANLSETLDDNQCVEIKKYFKDSEKFKYIRQKGVFPYQYVDDFLKLNQNKLPEKEHFFNNLSDEHITNEEYERAKNVWKLFNCDSIGDYSDIYLKSDVLLLADIFQNFRNKCINTYKLDPSHYYTFPGLSFDACLRHTAVELELLTDPDMLHFFKNSIRGGVSTCVSRKSIANNKFISTFDKSQPNKYILYLDATNLYGYAMSQYLPQKDFVWLSKDEIKNLNISNISDTSEKGYVLEVDLEYPKHLHDEHNEYPFCPENYKPQNSKTTKLIPNLKNKEKYIIHYTLLKQCIHYGLKLTKIHRAIKFTQSPWLKKYIDLNTKLRNESNNKFHKNTHKLANNSIYGKTMENIDRRTDVRLVTQWSKNQRKDGAENLIAKPYFKDHTIFSESLVAIQMQKVLVKYDKPVYVGFSILDISKTVMYNFFYGFLKPLYKKNVKLLYTDTDSFILEIQCENVYDDIKQHIDRFDTSNYANNNIHNMPVNMSIVGNFKDEYAGEPIETFYGTGAKAYCVKTKNSLVKKAKGIKRSAIKNQLEVVHYKDVVEKNSKTFCTMYLFRSRLHNIYTEMVNKLALTSTDDKRFKIHNSFDTLAWGHQDIPFYQWFMDHESDM